MLNIHPPQEVGNRNITFIVNNLNQGTPFNNDCPKVNGTKTPTGCVATAMAQVMNYWKYPEVGTGAGIIKLPDTGKQDVLQFRQKNSTGET